VTAGNEISKLSCACVVETRLARGLPPSVGSLYSGLLGHRDPDFAEAGSRLGVWAGWTVARVCLCVADAAARAGQVTIFYARRVTFLRVCLGLVVQLVTLG